MKKRSIVVILVVVSFYFTSNVFAAITAHWGYSGKEGPEFWGELHPNFKPCSEGKNQSPINLSGMVEGKLPEITFNYHAGGNEVINNGHAIQVNYTPKGTVKIDDSEFELKQLHFHSPSENTIEHESFPMEAHLVHADKEGNLAVIALMFKTGEKNSEIEKAWEHMPEKTGDKKKLKNMFDANNLLPENLEYYRFNGSLTTPPCSEGVRWLVMKQPVTVSKHQVEKFVHAMHHPNNRPVQPINSRLVLK